MYNNNNNVQQGQINHSWAPYQRKAEGPFLIHAARIFSGGASLGCNFLPQKFTTFFSRRYA